MSYRLNENEEIPLGIKRIAYEQIDNALNNLQQSANDFDEAIHNCRKSLKKLRGLLRLVRFELGETVYKRENICFRDAGRLLSDIRDSKVAIDTFEYGVETFEFKTEDDDMFQSIREALKEEYKATRHHVIEKQALDKASDMIRAASIRLNDWPIKDRSFTAFSGGLGKVYKRGRKRWQDAQDDPSAKAFHEWRKRVKYLWYNIRILQSIWPNLLRELADEIHDLSDLLGDEHDLAKLQIMFQESPFFFVDQAARMNYIAHLEQKRSDLHEQAFAQASRIYPESRNEFVVRLGAYWQATFG